MKKTTLIILIALINLLFVESITAEIKLPAIVSSNMVLQRNTTITIWGWADANEKISIKASWLDKDINIKADENGDWKVKAKTTNSKAIQSINIKSKTSNINLENILFGEVWLCSGQSNMEQPLNGFRAQPTFGGNMFTLKSKNPNLRIFTVKKVKSKTPTKDLLEYIPWQEASPNTVHSFSAIAYFFGEQLQRTLDVPVGLIHSSWGGSRIESWMSIDVLSKYKKVDISKNSRDTSTAMFNSMINPLMNFKIKGVLWYQGESNRFNPELYKKLFPAMVEDWRAKWNIGNFPFYYVQIAPYIYKGNHNFQNTDNTAFLRESQLKCLDLIPNSGIAITMDVGEENSIHPAKKKEVADRLLFNVLHKTYGYKTVDGASPIYSSLKVKEGGIILKFKNAETGLYTHNKLTEFEIAGDDKVFYPAEAKIVEKKNVFVKSDKVPNPVAVRYAWKNWVIGTLYDTNLLPAPSFRTDDWDDAKRIRSSSFE